MSRLVVVVGVLLVLLVVPLWLAKKSSDRTKAQVAAERIQAEAAAPSPARAESRPADAAPALERNNPDRHGLTFGWSADPTHARADCHGEPRVFDKPHRDSCNPYQGDTVCRTVLPLLCARVGGGPANLALATSTPVAGFLLASREDADARCAQELGSGWRMASFHDNPQGWALLGERPPGAVIDTRLRAWVFIGDQPGNCWSPP
jgi:hypothetical protein